MNLKISKDALRYFENALLNGEIPKYSNIEIFLTAIIKAIAEATPTSHIERIKEEVKRLGPSISELKRKSVMTIATEYGLEAAIAKYWL